jgi:hypothetical protein
MPSNMLKIIQSPVVASDYMARVLRLLDFVNYPDVLQSGRFKGHTKAYKYYLELLPAHTHIYKLTNLDEPLKFYDG